ncbi:MAG: FAD-dependent oxidoreductase [Anaerococcus sp.]|nr:FAD-dependent oxidoreductase [Peptoniphilaceae bacterium]MDY3054444.1 FAD-dependent oxidoreductase [Anaerococcus sp.]
MKQIEKKYEKLFSPISIGKCQIKNRTSLAPMGPVGLADANGGFSKNLQNFYIQVASHDVGLVITGITAADPSLEGIPPHMLPSPTYDPMAFIHSTYSMNEKIHAYGAKCFLQVTGGLGRSALPGFTEKFIAPSENGNRFDPRIEHREMTKEEIEQLIKKFAEAGVVAKMAGFDGLEVHAVHEGYLLDQFTMELFNRRNDEYGGSLENRIRLPIAILKAIKKACGEDFPVSLRFSLKSYIKALRQGALPGEEFEEKGRDIEEGIKIAKTFEEIGYDSLNVDAGAYDSWYWNHPPMYFEDGMYRDVGKIVKENVNIPVIMAGRMDNPDMAEEAIGESCDMVSYGRPLLADPELVSKIKTNRLDEVRPCVSCHEACMGRLAHGHITCAVNPSAVRFEEYKLEHTFNPSTILVVGGGLAGLEFARAASIRGHKVILCEKSDKFGGNIIPGCVPHFKRNDAKLIKYYEKQMELLGVDVRFNTEVTMENVESFGADKVIVATGSHPIKFPGDHGQEVYTADEILLGKKEAKENVVMIGGGLVGAETALWLAQNGKKVNIVEIKDEIIGKIGEDVPHMNYWNLMDLLNYHKVGIHTQAKITEIKEDSVKFEVKGQEAEVKADTVIAAIGYKEDDSLYEELSQKYNYIYKVGDCRKVHNIMYSIWDAYELARTI